MFEWNPRGAQGLSNIQRGTRSMQVEKRNADTMWGQVKNRVGSKSKRVSQYIGSQPRLAITTVDSAVVCSVGADCGGHENCVFRYSTSGGVRSMWMAVGAEV